MDNLKIGYGGTAREMARLMNESGVLGENLIDLNNSAGLTQNIEAAGGFAKIVEAIHAVQVEMGITGTTAQEAMDTIQGSARMAESAWKNLLTGIGRDDADLPGLLDAWIEAFKVSSRNKRNEVITIIKNLFTISPVVRDRIATEVASVMDNVKSKLWEKIEGTPIEALFWRMQEPLAKLRGIGDKAVKAFQGVIKKLQRAFVAVRDSVVQLFGMIPWEAIFNPIADWIAKGFEVAEKAIEPIGRAAKYIGDIINKMTSNVNSNLKSIDFGVILKTFVPVAKSIDKAFSIVDGVINNVIDKLNTAVDKIPDIGDRINENFSGTLTAAVDFVNSTIEFLDGAITPVVDSIVSSINTVLDELFARGEKVMNSLPGIFGLITAAIQNSGAVFSTFKTAFDVYVLPIIDSIPDKVHGVIDTVASFASDFVSEVTDVIDFVNGEGSGGSFSGGGKGGVISSLVYTDPTEYQGFLDLMKSITDTVAKLIGFVIGEVQKIDFSAVIAWIHDIFDAVLQLGNHLSGVLAPMIDSLIDTVINLADGFINMLPNLHLDGTISLLHGLLDVIANTFIAVMDLISSIGDLLWPIIEQVWNGIDSAFGDLASNANVTSAVFVDFVKGVGDLLTPLLVLISKVLEPLMYVLGPVLEAIWHVVLLVIEFVAELATVIGELIWAVIDGFDVVGPVIDSMLNDLGAFIDWLLSIPETIGNAFAGLIEIITSPFKTAFNFIADIWNSTIGGFELDVPDWVPIAGGSKIKIPEMPKFMAEGGVVMKATNAIVGEAGPEAVLPLDSAKAQDYLMPDSAGYNALTAQDIKAAIAEGMAGFAFNVDGKKISRATRSGRDRVDGSYGIYARRGLAT